ncbi:MAG: NADH-quinone oxidoreductase subunit C [Campylobacterota bacterium]|nr:NADH-quinone oxidoreductase subunit C [Campylobacterota bacterium]
MIELIKEKYTVDEKTSTLFKMHIQKNELMQTVHYLASDTNFITLSQISCTDWIEDGIFNLNYLMTTDKRDKNLMVSIDIKRDDETLPTLSNLFLQAQVMERDLHEMYGIKFIGNETLFDFALEDWQDIPPLRREFDTLAYVNEHFDFRGGRDDNKDVKVELKRRKAIAKKLKEQEEESKQKVSSDEN